MTMNLKAYELPYFGETKIHKTQLKIAVHHTSRA
jgi:hypothetical protein